jgi:hypothetical protein
MGTRYQLYPTFGTAGYDGTKGTQVVTITPKSDIILNGLYFTMRSAGGTTVYYFGPRVYNSSFTLLRSGTDQVGNKDGVTEVYAPLSSPLTLTANSLYYVGFYCGTSRYIRENGSPTMPYTVSATIGSTVVNMDLGYGYVSTLDPGTLVAVTRTFNIHLNISLPDIPSINLNLNPTTVHLQSSLLSGSIIGVNPIRYRVTLNGSQIQAWTPSSTTYLTNPSVSVTIQNNLLVLGDNTVNVEAINSTGFQSTKTYTLPKTNSNPTNTVGVSSLSIGTENVTVSGQVNDSDGDSITYYIYVTKPSDVPVLINTGTVASGTNISQVVNNSSFGYGNNTLEFKLTDNIGPLLAKTFTIAKNKIPAVISCTLTPSQVHLQNSSVTGTVSGGDSDKRYKVDLTNTNGTINISPWSDYYSGTINISHTINNTDLVTGSNNVVISSENLLGSQSSQTLTLTRVNNVPTNTFTCSSTVDRGDLNISGALIDSDGDTVNMTIKLNGVILDTYNAQSSPFNISYNIPNSLILIGANTVLIEYSDSLNGAGTWTKTVTKTNTAPSITASMSSMRLLYSISDLDGDLIQYKIIINGITQAVPTSGTFTPLTTSVNTYYDFASSQILIGQNNTVVITAKDSYGATTTVTVNFIGTYSGIMLHDGAGNYYTDDAGTFLEYLELGELIAGQESIPKVVYIQNLNGFSIKNVRVTTDYPTLMDGLTVLYSTTETPFIDMSSLLIPDTLVFEQSIPIYIKVMTELNITHGDEFDILVSADIA